MAFKWALKEYGKRNLNKMGSSETAPTPFSLSIRNAAKLLNINEKSAIKVLKVLQNLNMLKIYYQRPKKISDKKLPIKLFEDYPGYKYVTEQGTFIQFGSKIKLLEYPVKIPKISSKIYLKCYKSIQCKKYHNY